MDALTMDAPQPIVRGKRISARQLPGLVETHVGGLTDVPVSGALAKAMLEFNVHNRPLRAHRVANFKRILETGRWVNTGEPVIFSRTALNEGQHRLTAIAETGIEAPLDLRFGIAERAFLVTGTGATRSPADTLSIVGVPSGNVVAAAVRLLIPYAVGEMTGGGLRWRIGVDEVFDYIERWPDIIEAVRTTINVLGTGPNGFRGAVRASSVAATFLILRHQNRATVLQFLEALNTGVVPHKQDPARLLREKLASDWSLRVGTREAAIRRFALHLVAWQAWLAGERPKNLEWIPPEPFPYLPGVQI